SRRWGRPVARGVPVARQRARARQPGGETDRKSTRLNSSHVSISYAVFCLKKKTFYEAREGVVEEGSFTFHPGSRPHSPQGNAAQRSLATPWKVQARLAVMRDTSFASMRIT